MGKGGQTHRSDECIILIASLPTPTNLHNEGYGDRGRDRCSSMQDISRLIAQDWFKLPTCGASVHKIYIIKNLTIAC